MSFNPLPGIMLNWTESGEPLNNFQHYLVYRRVAGTTDWGTAIKQINDRGNTIYVDYTVESGVNYEYDVTQLSDFSGDDVESDHTAGVQGTLTIEQLFLHDPEAPGYYAEFWAETQKVSPEGEIAYLQPWNTVKPTAHIGNSQSSVFVFSMAGSWNREAADSLSREAWRALMVLFQRQREYGSVVLARQGRDIFAYCIIDSLDRGDEAVGFTASIRLREVDYEPGGHH